MDVSEPPEAYYKCRFICMHVCLSSSSVVFVLPGGIYLFVHTFVGQSICAPV